MALQHHYSLVPTIRFLVPHRIIVPLRHSSPRLLTIRSSVPFHKELEAAVDVVEKACHLCVDVISYRICLLTVKRSLLSGDGHILEKNDQTPITVADFGV